MTKHLNETSVDAKTSSVKVSLIEKAENVPYGSIDPVGNIIEEFSDTLTKN